jgi:L-threonylcarbamoyladenylate synthase
MTLEEHIIRAVDILNKGGIVIYPTDTAFGIGCRINDRVAVDQLFKLRKRPLTQATPVLVASEDMALSYYDSPGDIVRRLMRKYWPGALTIIAPCKKNLIYSPIRGGNNTIGLRQPGSETALALIRGAGVPILGPSANFHGDPTPYTFESLDSELTKLVDYVVPASPDAGQGGPGEGKVGNVSTVVDTTTSPASLVRQGAVTLRPEDLV